MDKLRTRITVSWDDGVSDHASTTIWQQNVTANGGTYSQTDTDALNDFMNSIDSFKTKFARLNLFIGGDLLACITPQIYIQANGGTIETNSGFLNADYSRTQGLNEASGVLKELDTNYNASLDSSMDKDNCCIGYWNDSASNQDIYNIYAGTPRFSVSCKYGGINYGFLHNETDYGSVASSNEGFYVWWRSGTSFKGYVDDVEVFSATKALATSKANDTLNIMTTTAGTTKCFGYFAGYDLTRAQLTTLHTAWATLNTALGR